MVRTPRLSDLRRAGASRLLFLVLLATLAPAPGTGARSKEPAPEVLAALDATGDAEAARRAAEVLLAEYKDHPRAGEAAEILGDYYYARGEYVTAARQYERAASGAADVTARNRRHCLRGRALLGASEGGLAARVFEGVLKQDPRSSEARLGLGDAFLVQGKAERAADIYRDLAKRGPTDPCAPLALAQLMRVEDSLGRHAEARTAAEALATGYPQSSDAAAARDRLRREKPSASTRSSGAPRPPAESEPATTEKAPRPRPAAADSARGAGYSLQLGAFGERENARELASRLEAWGLGAVRIEEEKRGERIYYRVRAGDYPDAASAEAAGTRLRDEHGVSYRVVER